MGITPIGSNEGTQFPTMQEMRDRALDVLSRHAFDEVVGYRELTDAIGLNPATSTRARAAVLKAGRTLLREHNKKIINVRNAGYRIVKPNEHVAVSKSEQARARRWLKRSLETVTHVALDDLSPGEVAKVMTEQARSALQLSFSRRIAKQKELPAKQDLELPSASRLIAMMRKKPLAS